MKLYTQEEYDALNETAVFEKDAIEQFLSDDTSKAPADVISLVKQFKNSIDNLKNKLGKLYDVTLNAFLDTSTKRNEKDAIVLKYANKMSSKAKINAYCIIRDYDDKELVNYYTKFDKYWSKRNRKINPGIKILKYNPKETEFDKVIEYAYSTHYMCDSMCDAILDSLQDHDGIRDIPSIPEFKKYNFNMGFVRVESASSVLDTAITLVEAGEIESAQILLTRLNEASGEKIDQNAMSTSVNLKVL